MVTKKQLESLRTESGGYTKATLTSLGVPWPPKSGWKKALLRGDTVTPKKINAILKGNITREMVISACACRICGSKIGAPCTKKGKARSSNHHPRQVDAQKIYSEERSGKLERASAHTKTPIKSGSRKTKSNTFYASWDWKQARYEALQLHGRQCMCCGWSPEPGSKGHLCVDHIKPRSKFPALALDVSNLQVLCNSCNMGKSNVHQDDFRAEWHGDEDEADPLTAQFNATMQ